MSVEKPAVGAGHRTLAAGALPRVAGIAARAFHTDPLFAWLLPHEPLRTPLLTEIMHAMIGLRAPLEGVVTDDAEEPRGVIAFEPPGGRTTRRDEIAAFGRRVPQIARLVATAPRAVTQLRRLLTGYGALEELARLRPAPPHTYIAVLTVDPRHQKSGVGGSLLRAVLGEADERGVPAHLETARPENLAYYARFGFETRGEVRRGEAPPIWIMSRAIRPG